MKNIINQMHLNYNYDNVNKSKPRSKTNIKQIITKKENKLLNKNDPSKKNKIINSYMDPKADAKNFLDKNQNKNKINIIKNNIEPDKLIEKKQNIQVQKEKEELFSINTIKNSSIKEIRLPPQLYDISYDILQYK